MEARKKKGEHKRSVRVARGYHLCILLRVPFNVCESPQYTNTVILLSVVCDCVEIKTSRHPSPSKSAGLTFTIVSLLQNTKWLHVSLSGEVNYLLGSGLADNQINIIVSVCLKPGQSKFTPCPG